MNEYVTNKKVANMIPGDKNIDICLILINLNSRNKIQDTTITQFIGADDSGSLWVNIYGEPGMQLKEGDIIFLKGAYTSLFKDNMILYAAKPGYGKLFKIGEFFMLFKEMPNMSLYAWKKERSEKTGLDVYIIDNNITSN